MKIPAFRWLPVLMLALFVQCARGGGMTGDSIASSTADMPSQPGVLASQEYMFASGSDEVWMSFNAVKGRVYTIATGKASLPSALDADTMLVLYDAAMNEIAKNDDVRDILPQFSLDDFKKDPLGYAGKILSMSPDRLEDGYFSKITWKAVEDGICRVKVIPHDGYEDSLGAFTCTVSESD